MLHAGDDNEIGDGEDPEPPHAAVQAPDAPEGLLAALKTVSWWQVTPFAYSCIPNRHGDELYACAGQSVRYI